MNHSSLTLTRALAALALISIAPMPAPAQDGGPGTGGAVRLDHLRRFAGSPYRVLVIGAHPDDENTELITILTRGYGASTAYLSLTRGEGGQNLIGAELGPALGVLRAGELLAARKVDGARQFFTRAFDFGFSKSAEEALEFWPRDSLLKDVIRVVRRFRPHVIVSVFSGTPRDGHGHHQVAGMIAREAFGMAGDSLVFPGLEAEEGLVPWTPQKFYRNYGVTDGVTLDGGVLDTVTGYSLHQIAMRSRSQHRSQDMGQSEDPGPSRVTIGLEARAGSSAGGTDGGIFDGVRIGKRDDGSLDETIRLIERRIVLDAWIPDHEVTPGQQLTLNMLAWNAGNDTASVQFDPLLPAGWSVDSGAGCIERPTRVAPGSVARCAASLRIADEAVPSQPYYLVKPMNGAMYQWVGDHRNWAEPFELPPQVRAGVRFGDGTSGSDLLEIVARSVDQGIGEIRTPVTVVPRAMVALSPGGMLWPASLERRKFTVSVEYAAPDTATATVRLAVPDGWRVDAPRTVHFTRQGERAVLDFTVTRPATVTSGVLEIRAEVVVDGEPLRLGAERISYSHVTERVLFQPATARVVVTPVQFATGRRIGYLRGAADAIPDALNAAGVSFRLLSDDDLLGSIVDSLDVVVIGPRAYETSDAVRRAHPQLLRFAERGGTLIIQYQQYQFIQGGFAPLPFTIARPHDRVTDENAAVRWIDRASPIATTPNRITDADFADWIQERGLYFADRWDGRWTPVLEMDERGEDPKRGGLLVAGYGRGTVIYTGLAFFRQLPAAVPGAWRLFANLLAQ